MPVPDGLDGMRVDAGLARLLGLSRTAVAALTEEGTVLVDGAPVGKSDRLSAGSWLEVQLPEPPRPLTIEAQPVEGMEILYADDDIVAVDKPVGVAAHASVGWTGPTVIGGLAAAGFRISTSGLHERQGIVHRLDVGTSGVMVVATSERAYTVLKRAFKQRTIDKRYHALVQGHPDPSSGTIDAPIGRHRSSDWKFTVAADGKPSVTHYDTIEAFQAASLLDVHLETGRTHQIRVHMAHIDHPVVGDPDYAQAFRTKANRLPEPLKSTVQAFPRQALHARLLVFRHPVSHLLMRFEAPLPRDMGELVEGFRNL